MSVFRRLNFRWYAAIVVVLLLVGAVTMQIVLLQTHPIATGSSYISFGGQRECPRFEPTGTISRCTNFPYESEGDVAIGFSVRNTGHFPLTITAVGSFGAESDIWLAELHPFLPPEGELFSADDVRPFEPVSISAGEEKTIQLMGQMRECDVLRNHWVPGSSVSHDSVGLRVRWLLMTTDLEIPLGQRLRIEAPDGSRCE